MAKKCVFSIIPLAIFIQFAVANSDRLCDSPPALETNRPCEEKEEYPVSTIVKYCCEAGYRYSGENKFAICVLDDDGEKARWEVSVSECRPVSCSSPDAVSNGHIIGNRYTFPNSVKYECDKGYELQGLTRRYCEVTGEWSGRKPRCQAVTCPHPDKIENGNVNFLSTEYSSVATYTCSSGYLIEGQKKRRCNDIGVWEPDVPTCVEVFCPEPKDPLHGKVTLITGGTRKNSLISYSCNEGTTLRGESFANCMQDGRWSSEPPTCSNPCSVKRLGRGKLGVNEYSRGRLRFVERYPHTEINSGEKLILKCNHNYELPVEDLIPGDVEILCEDGILKPEPACHPAWCRRPPPDNGIGIPPSPPYNKESGSVVVYKNACSHIGKTLEEKKALCQFGTWKVTKAKCQDSRCNVTELVKFNVDISGKRMYESGDKIEIRCERSYESSIDDVLCVEGQWQITSILCSPKPCRHPPPGIIGARSNVSSGKHGERVVYQSIPPYELVKEGSIVCSFGQWLGKLPVSKDTRCHTNSLIEYDGIKTENKTIKNKETYQPLCLDGYDNLGATFECNNGEWEKSTEKSVVCEPGICIVPSVVHGDFFVLEIENGWFTTSKKLEKVYPNTFAKHGSELKFKCQGERKLQGRIETTDDGVTITCNKKQWIPNPECWFFPPDTTTISTSTTNEPTEHPFKENEMNVIIPEEKVENETAENLNNRNGSEIAPDILQNCAYTNLDVYLLMFLDDQVTEKNIVISHGSELKFGCQPVGLVRLVGPVSTTCINGEWEPNNFPKCFPPKIENQVNIMVHSDKSYSTLPGNVVKVNKNSALSVFCYLVGRRKWPTMFHTSSIGQTNAKAAVSSDGGRFVYINIPNMVEETAGTFTCYSESDSHSISVSVSKSMDLTNVQCPRLNLTSHLSILYEPQSHTLLPDTKVYFSCTDRMWELKGVLDMTCLKTGRWSANPPICIRKCWPPPEISNGYKNGETLTVGSDVIYTCHKGYKLSGSSTTTCQNNGFWSNQPPRCLVVQCPVPSSIPNGNVHYTSLYYDSEIQYQCKHGYILVGSNKLQCTDDGKWNNKPPVCKEDLPQCNGYHLAETLPEDVFGLNITSEYMPSGSVVQLVCHGKAMVMLGKKYAICTEKGFWEVVNTKCVPGCHPINKPNNSSLIIEEVKEMYRFGDYITFSCPQNEKLSTDIEHIVCMSNGWSDESVPFCLPP